MQTSQTTDLTTTASASRTNLNSSVVTASSSLYYVNHSTTNRLTRLTLNPRFLRILVRLHLEGSLRHRRRTQIISAARFHTLARMDTLLIQNRLRLIHTAKRRIRFRRRHKRPRKIGSIQENRFRLRFLISQGMRRKILTEHSSIVNILVRMIRHPQPTRSSRVSHRILIILSYNRFSLITNHRMRRTASRSRQGRHMRSLRKRIMARLRKRTNINLAPPMRSSQPRSRTPSRSTRHRNHSPQPNPRARRHQAFFNQQDQVSHPLPIISNTL